MYDSYDFDDTEEAYEQGLEDAENGGNLFGVLFWIIVIYLIFGRKIGTYEGLSAEEWFNEYDYAEGQLDEIRSCVSNYNYFDSAEDIYYRCYQ